MTIQEISFKNSTGTILSGIIRFSEPSFPTKYPVVIVLHGFSESKHHDLTADIANSLVHYGFLTLRFDFHGHGDSEGEFEEHTIHQQVDDVQCALDFISDHKYADKNRIAVIGTDIGANIALLAAAKDPRIRAIISQGARSHFEHHLKSWFAPHEFTEMMTRGIHNHVNFKLRKEYVTSTRMHDMIEHIKNVHSPILFVHATADLRVRIEETRQLYLAANQPKHIEEIEGADHWLRETKQRELLVKISAEWFRQYLR